MTVPRCFPRPYPRDESCCSQQCSMFVHVVFDAMHHGATSTERRLGMRGGWVAGWVAWLGACVWAGAAVVQNLL